MPRLYVLVKRSSAKSWTAAIPVKTGVTRSRVKTVIAQSRKKGYSYRIVSDNELKKLVAAKKPKRRTKKRTRRKKRK